MNNNLILDVDSYKVSHWLQYPPDTTAMYSYVESRGGKYPVTVFFGLQYILKRYLSQSIELWMVEEANALLTAHGLPFNYEGWRYIAEELKGRLPIRIKAVPEGLVIPVHNVLMTVESTDPKVFWLTSWLETLLMRVWYPITVATQSWHLKQHIYQSLQRTADDPDGEICFKLHDFGARGVSTCESSGIGGLAHLVNFQGSDTVQALVYGRKYYHSPMAAYSIPAAEHSTITAWGREGEVLAYENMLTQFAKPGSVLAVVSDSYDLWNAIDHLWGDRLRQQVIDSGATVVLRPDSGNPVEIVAQTLEKLAARFGSTVNGKGFRVLNAVRVIQGDGVDGDSIATILERTESLGFSTTNLAFGIGGTLLQKLNRDTQKFAMKCSEVTVAGKATPICKDPITDPGKASKKGRLSLIKTESGYQTVPTSTEDLLQVVYENGQLLQDQSLDVIRQRAWLGIDLVNG
ncbi:MULTISPECIES: nicotinate phosphoribosyltransferase [unclassified Synechocystis]|uniref:nicotinate phosphoribosyltransferase n=1 Tax=unclassified Synechocystis TaxID=2640012 RepID=UPI00041792CB|nr:MULTISPECIES: nicotinate phosphoribosyltransferase [unclassified Synechocystis]AIE74003.1 Nicotinamide phosphoribosyltransferase [Synechocystis sp. PCC 6714]MCT0252564.1 nicotinate phosphoribosyltransferase [Synechocystis sp. CS-94]